jgi:hypothetical protein
MIVRCGFDLRHALPHFLTFLVKKFESHVTKWPSPFYFNFLNSIYLQIPSICAHVKLLNLSNIEYDTRSKVNNYTKCSAHWVIQYWRYQHLFDAGDESLHILTAKITKKMRVFGHRMKIHWQRETSNYNRKSSRTRIKSSLDFVQCIRERLCGLSKSSEYTLLL